MKSLVESRLKRDAALRLAAMGRSFEDIAREVGYSHRGSAHRAVYKALGEHEAADVEAFRALEIDRLDALLRKLWERIDQGDVAAIEAAIRICDLRCRILGLHGPAKRSTDNTIDPNRVLVMASGTQPRAGNTSDSQA